MKKPIYIICGLKNGERVYLAEEQETAALLGQFWMTRDIEEVRVYFSKKAAEDEVAFVNRVEEKSLLPDNGYYVSETYFEM